MRILVVRFRQMGDAILATSLLNTLRQNFPDAEIDFVLNARIAPLFEGHPAISRIITFTEEERHGLAYIRKVWKVMHSGSRYDVIIDMRSTVNTLLFALFSPATKYRIGRHKWYTCLVLNHRIKPNPQFSMIDTDLSFAEPLNAIRQITPTQEFTLHITEEEQNEFRQYLVQQGVDMKRPRILVNVTAKLANKVWNEDKMVWVLDHFLKAYPDWQVLFNYAPGDEEKNARRIYARLGSPQQVLIDVQAHSARQLVAMGHNMTCFFGNEGGARHVMHAAGCPTLVICAPGNKKHVWIPKNRVRAEGIAPSDFASAKALATMDRTTQYDLIDQESVWRQLNIFIQSL